MRLRRAGGAGLSGWGQWLCAEGKGGREGEEEAWMQLLITAVPVVLGLRACARPPLSVGGLERLCGSAVPKAGPADLPPELRKQSRGVRWSNQKMGKRTPRTGERTLVEAVAEVPYR